MQLTEFNSAAERDLRPLLLACCNVPQWATAVLNGRPYSNRAQAYKRADLAAQSFDDAEIEQALAGHPRIGEQARGAAQHAAWSRQEQSGVGDDRGTKQALAQGNQAYEERFSRIFLISAAGLDSTQILDALTQRLTNDAATETEVVARELRTITLARFDALLPDESAS